MCARLLALLLLAACGRIGFAIGDGGSGGGGGDGASSPWQHLPAGCAVFEDTTFAVVPPAGWGQTGTVDTSVDATAPYEPTVARWTFPVGFMAGYAPGQLIYDPAALLSPSITEYYVGLVWKASNPWQGASNGFSTIYYFIQNNAGSGVLQTLTLNGTAPPYDLMVSYADAVDYFANVDDATVSLDQWHVLEMHRRASSTASSGDGLLEWWIDGVQVGSYPTFDTVLAPFQALQLEPIWSGVGTKTETDYFWMDRVAVCGL